MGDSIEFVNRLVDHAFTYGAFWVYAVIFVACFIENLFPPFPGDTFIVASGALVASHRLELLLAALVVLGGGVFSVMIVYTLGRRYGRDYFIRRNYRYFSAADIEQVERYFTHWGAPTIIFSRFIVGMRTVLSLVAGISRYPSGLMLVFSVVSYILFGGLLMYMGYVLVENIEVIGEYIRTYNRIVWPIVIVAVLAYVVVRFRASRRNKSK